MILYFSKSQRTRKKCARYCILLAFFLCLALPPCLASAEENYWQGFIDLYNQLSHMEGVMGDIRSNQDFWYPIMAGVSNAPSGGDLNNNPWWATNSAFALTQRDYSRVYPSEKPDNAGTFSFPQFMSHWSGMLTYPNNTSANSIRIADLRKNWFTYFGSDYRTYDANSAKPYTWFDWMADMMRSNFIANAAISTNELAQWAEQSGADYVEEFSSQSNQLATAQAITNGIDDLLSATDDLTTGVEQNANTLFSSFHLDRVLPETYTGGDPTIEIFPETTIGGVHVSAVRGSILLPNGVAYWVNLVARFLWSVLFLVAFFALAKNEYTYWVSLGHTEGNAA